MEAIHLPNHPNVNLPEKQVDIISGETVTRAKNHGA
jgi:hypothetical protein